MPFHTQYADGSPRPLCRGWLHGMSALASLSLTYEYWNDIPSVATPVVINICSLFLISSLVHLVPWQSKTLEEAITRLDKACILALCLASFMTPQLHESDACKPEFVYSLVTAAIPVGLGVIGVLCGAGPIAFASFVCPVVSSMWFYGMHVEDSKVFYCILGSTVLYAIGFYLYGTQAGGHHPVWGYHEWFHLLATIGLVISARAVFAFSAYTNETCSPSTVLESVVGIVSNSSNFTEELYSSTTTIEMEAVTEVLVWSGLRLDLSFLPAGI
ncbi:channel protein, hemolysin iii family [Seminavis robusta]|uniref:Channel protein, hemolysin iii family n=1 Tax=Seminavis robusta TaxID=568900 RepID=A0A9N8HBR3_9STRA|nr:channel protein, hemolysin iii family [Seminavis robusta]|eukprot:Sro192_g082430.1 channel protein, hemolysin iii family (272) ;mRNA; r:16104-16919